MKNRAIFSRRKVLKSALALGSITVVTPVGAAIPPFTPNQVMGPFYPVEKPLDQDADLTLIAGKAGQAQGQVVHLMGRVIDSRGQPVPDARIEIWQANTHGRYTHPSDSNPAPLDPNFEGFGVQVTDAEGRYRFKTIKPGPYPVTQSWSRPPHIHVDVTGAIGRVLTQMYFQDEPLNEVDKLLQGSWNSEALIAMYQEPSDGIEPDALVAVWDVMLPQT
jgi:protocatechuate 3,4-dioxygenase beta subunit